MINISLNKTKQWLKRSETPLAKGLFTQLKKIGRFEIPAPRLAVTPLYFIHCSLRTLITTLTRILWWTPLLKGRCDSVGHNLNLFGGLPFISGALRISMGDNCRISGHTTFSGRTCAQQMPELRVGNNVDIGYMTTIAVGQRVEIGNNVRIAGHAFLAGYPGHPLDAKTRAAGQPETDDQVGNIILEEDVWLATNVSILAGVRVGRGTIVATGSVVTRDLPAMVLAAGIPARVIRHLDNPENKKNQ
ncbi:MAG: acyltransferase [Gammaproteobacteria bacterium]|nr:acyltransferase [Gammaproteobacteria bacterium]MCF6259425.1 acyltransferase [Gammaproteobacteria bacterium]